MTIVRGCTGIFSNLLSHAGVQEYFQVECHKHLGARNIFELTVERGCPGLFSNWMSHAGVKEQRIFLLTVTRKGQGVFSN